MKDHASRYNILLVDCNERGLKARQIILQDDGYNVETATGGEEGWQLFQSGHFDVVVTDLKMEGMDGIELIRRIQDADTPARTILLSGLVNCLGLTTRSTGADEVISKSNNEMPELQRAVKKLASRPRPRKPASSRNVGVPRTRSKVNVSK